MREVVNWPYFIWCASIVLLICSDNYWVDLPVSVLVVSLLSLSDLPGSMCGLTFISAISSCFSVRSYFCSFVAKSFLVYDLPASAFGFTFIIAWQYLMQCVSILFQCVVLLLSVHGLTFICVSSFRFSVSYFYGCVVLLLLVCGLTFLRSYFCGSYFFLRQVFFSSLSLTRVLRRLKAEYEKNEAIKEHKT